MTIYVVRNREGQFYRAKGYGGSGDSWVPTLERARLYTKVGMAKAQVTFWFRTYPQYGCPSVVAYELGEPRVMDVLAETSGRIEKTKTAALKAERERNADLVKHYAEERDKLDRRIKELAP